VNILVAPLEALTDPLLSDPERRVLLALFSYRGKVTELVFPSLDALSERSNINDKTRISKITTSLAKKGWLTKKKKGFTGCNQYTMCMPERLTNLDSDAKLVLDTKLDADTNPKLDADTKYDVGLSCHVQRTNHITNHINKPVKRKTRAVFVKPSIDEIENFMADYCQENSLSLSPNEPTKYFHYFESNGWLVAGKTPMKKWKSSVIGWLQRNQTNKTNGGYSNGTNQQQSARTSSYEKQLAAAKETIAIYS
jgi:hypothetical protein